MATQQTTRRGRRAAAPPPERPAVAVPRFSHPADPVEEFPGPPAETDMPLIEERTSGPLLDNHGSGVLSRPYAAVGSTGTIRTRTEDSSDSLTSSTSKAEVARNAAVFLGAIIGVSFGIAALGLARAGRQLRRPTKDETRDIARPLARVMVRHLPVEYLTADLADIGEAGAAVERYMSAGPVAPRIAAVEHIGMEHAPPDDPAPTTPAAPAANQIWHDATTLDQYPSALVEQGPKPEVTYAP